MFSDIAENFIVWDMEEGNDTDQDEKDEVEEKEQQDKNRHDKAHLLLCNEIYNQNHRSKYITAYTTPFLKVHTPPPDHN